MSTLMAHEKAVFEKLFDCGGYVLDFTNDSYADFFREHNIEIDAQKYRSKGNSKMKRLRAFWEIEPDPVVARVMLGLLQYAKVTGTVEEKDEENAVAIIHRLEGKAPAMEKPAPSEKEFLQKNFQKVDINRLQLEPGMQVIIEQRLAESQKALEAGVPLAVIFLCGSTLEGLLLDLACKQPQQFNTATEAPKDKEGKVKPFWDWTLNDLINVAHETKHLSLDVKKFGHALRDFRNYIHPRAQLVQNFTPDNHTAEISWQVLRAAIADLAGER